LNTFFIVNKLNVIESLLLLAEQVLPHLFPFYQLLNDGYISCNLTLQRYGDRQNATIPINRDFFGRELIIMEGAVIPGWAVTDASPGLSMLKPKRPEAAPVEGREGRRGGECRG
jgi:hypothetical protein